MITPEVKVGQVWADNDKRSTGRHVLVVALLSPVLGIGTEPRPQPARAEVALCTRTGQVIRDSRGRDTRTKIRVSRFRPTSNGYRLVRDVEDGTR